MVAIKPLTPVLTFVGILSIVFMHACEMLGNLVGAVICQIQTPKYPVFRFMLPEIVFSYSYIYLVLIGILAANYVRELRNQKASTLT